MAHCRNAGMGTLCAINIWFRKEISLKEIINNMTQTEFALLTIILAGVISFATSLITTAINNGRMKKDTYINTITSNRIEWIQQFKLLVSEFLQLTTLNSNFELYCEDEKEKRSQFFGKLKVIRSKIFLHLNYQGKIDREIIRIINHIFAVLESVYEIIIIKEIQEGSDMVGYIKIRAELNDIEFFNIMGIDIEHAKKANRQECIDMFCNYGKNRVDNFLKILSNSIIEVERLHNELIRYSQVYCKAEWDRVKKESRGSFKRISDEDVEKMIDSYDLELFNYSFSLIEVCGKLDDIDCA
jgi:hypothetical protein